MRAASVSCDRVTEVRDLLVELGYDHPQAAARAVEVLIAAGLLNPKRSALAASKLEACRGALALFFVLLCDHCATRSEDTRDRLSVADRRRCERCGGSSNRAAVENAAESFRGRGLRRLVVVGGSPSAHEELRRLWPLDLRVVDGTERHMGWQARANLDWADLVVVWASTELNHATSGHYTSVRGELRRKVVVAPRRGIEALADAIAS